MPGKDEGTSAKKTAASRRRASISSKGDVLKAILKREHDGLPLNRAAVLRQDRELHNAMLRIFDSWDHALRAAGIDPGHVRNHRKWSRQAVVRRILELAAEDRPLNAGAIQRSEATLASAAGRWFRCWDDALDAAGIDPAIWARRVPRWTKERILQTIQSIHRSGGAVSHAVLRRNSITQAAKLLFGSWDAALRAAGLDPNVIRVYRKPWTPEEVVQEIRRKARSGEPLNAKNVSPYSLRRRGRIFFGSWDAALAAAGLDPAKVRKNKSRGNRWGHRRAKNVE